MMLKYFVLVIVLFIGVKLYARPMQPIAPLSDSGKVMSADTLAQFPGGKDSLVSFIGRNLVYPEMERSNGITGRVVVSFVVDKDGSIENIKVVKSIEKGLNEAAVDCVKKMPKWIPGKYLGENIPNLMSLPFNFKIN